MTSDTTDDEETIAKQFTGAWRLVAEWRRVRNGL